MKDAVEKARTLLDDAHAADPRREDGAPYERVYADRLEAWVRRLVPAPTPALRLAARAQHLERWAIPRETYLAGRGGYLRWRVDVHHRQGDRARELLLQAGCDAAVAERVAALVSKTAPRDDADAQVLEDAACLVFLETELAPFMRDTPREKTIDILRKTWRKMSAAAQQAATQLALPAEAASAVAEALGR